MNETSNANLEGAQNKVKRLKRIGQNKNIIKSPYYNDPNKNPCIPEQNMSRKCWIENEANVEACTDHYDNYKICMRFWNWIEWERYWNNTKPYLPPPEERPEILKARMREFKESDSFKTGVFRSIFHM